MYALARPALFALSPTWAHAVAMAALGPVEHLAPLRALVRAAFRVERPELNVRALGLDFANPIGLAGGFDKNARRPRAMAALGFGHLELGTVTASAQAANPAPNLFRLPQDRALVNRLGFPNDGASALHDRLRRRRSQIDVPVAVSIGKSRHVGVSPIEDAIADYARSFEHVRSVADFVVVNVSSPNTKDLRAMQGADLARALLGALVASNGPRLPGASAPQPGDPPSPPHPRRIPLLVKVAPDLHDAELEALLEVVEQCGLDGVVATNTTLSRADLATAAAEVERIGAGGLSGAPLRRRAREMVRRIRTRLGPETTVVGVGGIANAADALAMMRAGANLVQLYTGFVYGGPGTIRTMNMALAETVRREGAASLAELTRAAWGRGEGQPT